MTEKLLQVPRCPGKSRQGFNVHGATTGRDAGANPEYWIDEVYRRVVWGVPRRSAVSLAVEAALPKARPWAPELPPAQTAREKNSHVR